MKLKYASLLRFKQKCFKFKPKRLQYLLIILLILIIIIFNLVNLINSKTSTHSNTSTNDKLKSKYYEYEILGNDENSRKQSEDAVKFEATDQLAVNVENNYDDNEEGMKSLSLKLKSDYENYINQTLALKLQLNLTRVRTEALLKDFTTYILTNLKNLTSLNEHKDIIIDNAHKGALGTGNIDGKANLLTFNRNELKDNKELGKLERLLSHLSESFMQSLSQDETNAKEKSAYKMFFTDDGEPKLALHFRSTNIYRIDLNCFWTKSLLLYKEYKYEYKYAISHAYDAAKFCPTYKRKVQFQSIDDRSTMSTTIIKYLLNQIKIQEIRPYDGLFLSDFLTKSLVNGGGWFPGFDYVRYKNDRNPNLKHIFQLNTNDEDCVPKERIAIIVAIRDREENLNNFLIYMHHFMQKQLKAYKIFVVEQSNTVASGVLFNKGRLYNTGFKEVLRDFQWEFNCVILHDVDLLPLNSNLDYSCADMPKHMSINVRRLGDNSLSPHYRFLTGGVLALRPEHYETINGYSNEYFGWGGEDDDLSIRIVEKELCVLRSSKNISYFVMQEHRQSTENKKRWEKIMTATDRIDTDGLTNVEKLAKIISTKEFTKFTRILVDVVYGDFEYKRTQQDIMQNNMIGWFKGANDPVKKVQIVKRKLN